MSRDSKPKSSGSSLTDISPAQIAAYLRDHPDFFEKHRDVLETISAPEVSHGKDNIVDLQRHMVSNLQKGLKTLRGEYEGLVISSRDNMSTLHQVHQAALSLIRAPSLERLLEVITLDLLSLFNVDIVRLCIESDAADLYESNFGEQNASGILFLEEGLIDKTLGRDKSILLVSDTTEQFIYGFEAIFSDCSGIVESAALLRMRLPSSQRNVLLAFGVRVPKHFYPGQGTEMLSFLAQIVEHRLDQCLSDCGIAHLI